MKVAAITGVSGAGKTTLIVALIRRFVAAGERVGAIKHTHHVLNEERRGDTGAFLDAGAEPVVFAGNGEAVVFRHNGVARSRYADERELLRFECHAPLRQQSRGPLASTKRCASISYCHATRQLRQE